MDVSQSGAVTTISACDTRAGWVQWVLLMSDIHHDSVQCNRELELEHLQEAKRRGAWVLVNGDLFDAMQGRFDPRRSMAELRPEYRRDDYYDFVVKDTAEFLMPFKDNLVMISDGNHEMSVLKNASTNLNDRLVHTLRLAGSPVVHGGYGGWIILHLYHGQDDESPKHTLRIKYFHGAGGDAPVTKGVIATNRQAVYLPDADIVWNGHNHNEYVIALARERLSTHGKQFFDLSWHVRTPGYKQGYADGSGGWEVMRGSFPKPIGSVWLRLEYQGGAGRTGGNHSGRLLVQPVEDIRGPSVISPAGEAMTGGFVYGEDGGDF